MTENTKPCKHGYRNFCPVPDCDHGKLGRISAGPAPDLSVYVHSQEDTVEAKRKFQKIVHGIHECSPSDKICAAHVSHPCEKCGKLSGQAVFILTQSQLYKLLIEQSGLTYENCVQHGYEVEHAGHSAANDTIEGLQAERELVYNGEMKAMTSQLDLHDIFSRRYHEGLLDASKIVDFLKQAITEISTPEQAQAITERFREIERAARNAKE